MILKSFELNKIDLKKDNLFLLYGENEGLKEEITENKFKKAFKESTYSYEEGEVLKDRESFFNNIFSKSFFEDEKLILVSRSSDKIVTLIEEIIDKNIKDLVIVLNAGALDKKSKLRSLFEKQKKTVCIAFYEDNNQTLSGIIIKFFKDKKIPISQQTINLLAQRSRGDRQNLKNELEKIESFIIGKDKVETQDLLKLTNLAENYSVSELIDGCLAKNRKKIINILNENNYSTEDCILIIRTFLIKSKRLLKISLEIKNKKNIDDIISFFKPPIFWKDKDIIKQQISNWSYNNIEKLIVEIGQVEFLIKKNSTNSINILSNFIIEQANSVSN